MIQIKVLMMGAMAVFSVGLAIYSYYNSTPQQHSYSHRSNNSNYREDVPSWSPSLTITSKPSGPPKKRKKSKPDSCSICLDTTTSSKPIVNLSCDHSFHNHCIKSWFNTNDTCPNCRSKINCSICMDPTSSSQPVVLSCQHVFHKHCINGWINSRHDTCPICRSKVQAI